MERIWAPWRLQYVENADDPGGCFLCEYPAEGRDAERLIVARGRHAFAVLNAYPYSNGHLMVAPYEHTADLDALDAETILDVWRLVTGCVRALGQAYQPDGYNIGVNLGRVAGAGLKDHVHVHIVPRWNGDTNFMAVLADTRVLPASLRATYDRVKEHLRDG
jgi:ATP adenylyltransferase